MSPHAGYLLQEEVVPRLASAIPNAVAFIGSEDAEELIQDATAIAAKIMHNAELSGKQVVKRAGGPNNNAITAGNVAYYTIEKLRTGRRSTGSTIVDVHGSGTQIRGNTRLASLDEEVPTGEDGLEVLQLHDVLSNDQEDPATKAARKMDWDSFMAGLSERDLAVIQCLVDGEKLSTLARALGCCGATLSKRKHRLAKAIAEFMGGDILIQIRRQPGWKDCLTATRERLACRDERRGH
jgi:DNA-directed RNA polymerase specialized sigma24 family protein